MSTAGWFHIVGLISAFLLGFGFIAALISVGLSWKLNDELQSELVRLNTDLTNAQTAQGRVETELAEAKTKQAEAERALLELQQLIREPRTLDETKAAAILDAGAKGLVQILFVAGDEPKNLANKISAILSTHGWTVTAVNIGISSIPPGIEVGVSSEDSKEGEETPESVKTLCNFLSESVERNPSVRAVSDKGLPKNSPTRILVGTKY
jgi:hypothetical protein